MSEFFRRVLPCDYPNDEIEAERVANWHGTFDAALTRAHSGYTAQEACAYAADHADIVHGPIERIKVVRGDAGVM